MMIIDSVSRMLECINEKLTLSGVARTADCQGDSVWLVQRKFGRVGKGLLVIQWWKKSLLYAGELDGTATVTADDTALRRRA